MKHTTLTYHLEELLLDISNRCLIAAKAVKADGNSIANDAFDVLDDGNREIVLGIIERLMFECMNILFPYASCSIDSRKHCNRPKEVQAYAMTLRFSHERSETQVMELNRTVHDYVVCKVVAEWMAMALPNANWQKWETKAQELRERIVTVLATPLYPRTLRIKPHLY